MDRGKVVLSEYDWEENGKQMSREKKNDEIKQYLHFRYLSVCEEAWRIFNFEIQHKEAAVESWKTDLSYREWASGLHTVIDKPGIKDTMFTA